MTLLITYWTFPLFHILFVCVFAVLFDVMVLLYSAWKPVAVLLFPVVLFCNAEDPNAELFIPVWLPNKALYPNPVLLFPVVFSINE